MEEKLGERIGEHLSAIILGRKKEKAAGNRRAPIKTTSLKLPAPVPRAHMCAYFCLCMCAHIQGKKPD